VRTQTPRRNPGVPGFAAQRVLPTPHPPVSACRPSQPLEHADRVAIAKHAMRGKQHLVMVRPFEGGLLLEQLRYANEVRSFEDVPLEEGDVDASELDLAVKLVDQASSDAFQATDYKDDVHERMLDLIEQKVDGEDIAMVAQEEPQTQIIDPMAALKASLAEEGSERKPAKAAEGEKKKGPARKRATN